MVTLLAALSSCTAIHTPDPYLPSRNGIQAGETITVKGDENIYAIAHEHNVSMRELIVLNDLKPPFEVRPGQSLVLPANGSSFAGDLKAPEPAPLEPVEKNALPPVMPSSVTSESLEPIATPPVTPAPAPTPAPTPARGPARASPQSLIAPMAVSPSSSASAAPPPAAASSVQSLNRPSPPQMQAATTLTTSSAASATSAIDMKWPVQGPILSGFGAKSAGVTNDGVNIGAPKGAPVTAAAAGTVVYAGNEMKGFGNLVLIRHEGDWVTAYAHLDRVLVKKDTVVAQGDEIGTVGKTGDASSPQLHFETREGGKPVDPAKVVKAE